MRLRVVHRKAPTFAARALGYGIDNVTLLGLTLAVGLVEDDERAKLRKVVTAFRGG